MNATTQPAESTASPRASIPEPPLSKSGTGAIVEAIEAGLIVHVAHPDFGGCLTVGRSLRSLGASDYAWEVIHHGGSCDVGYEGYSALDVARYVESQVGRRRSYWAA